MAGPERPARPASTRHQGLAGTGAPEHVDRREAPREPGRRTAAQAATRDVHHVSGSCSDRPGPGWTVSYRVPGPGVSPAVPSRRSHRATLVTLVPRSRVRITRRARPRPASRRAAADGDGSSRMARPTARPAPPPAMTSRASSRTSPPRPGGAHPRNSTGTPTLATTRPTASTRAPARRHVGDGHLEQRRTQVMGDDRGQDRRRRSPGTWPRPADHAARSGLETGTPGPLRAPGPAARVAAAPPGSA